MSFFENDTIQQANYPTELYHDESVLFRSGNVWCQSVSKYSGELLLTQYRIRFKYIYQEFLSSKEKVVDYPVSYVKVYDGHVNVNLRLYEVYVYFRNGEERYRFKSTSDAETFVRTLNSIVCPVSEDDLKEKSSSADLYDDETVIYQNSSVTSVRKNIDGELFLTSLRLRFKHHIHDIFGDKDIIIDNLLENIKIYEGKANALLKVREKKKAFPAGGNPCELYIYLKDGEECFLFPSKKEAESFVEKLNRILHQLQKRQKKENRSEVDPLSFVKNGLFGVASGSAKAVNKMLADGKDVIVKAKTAADSAAAQAMTVAGQVAKGISESTGFSHRDEVTSITDAILDVSAPAPVSGSKTKEKKNSDDKKQNALTTESVLTILFFLIAADGNIRDDELTKYDLICHEIDPDNKTDHDMIETNCRQHLEKADKDEYYDFIQEGVEAAFYNNKGTLSPITPKMLIWNMILLANCDNEYHECEKRLIKYTARKYSIDKSVVIDMENIITELSEIEKKICAVKKESRPYEETETILNELKKQKDDLSVIIQEMTA